MLGEALKSFARLLGIRDDQAEDAIVSERAAKAVLTRRSFLVASSALTTGALFSFAAPEEPIFGVDRKISPSSFDAALKKLYPEKSITSYMAGEQPFFVPVYQDTSPPHATVYEIRYTPKPTGQVTLEKAFVASRKVYDRQHR